MNKKTTQIVKLRNKAFTLTRTPKTVSVTSDMNICDVAIYHAPRSHKNFRLYINYTNNVGDHLVSISDFNHRSELDDALFAATFRI